jgi:hypothetical protein
MNDQEKILSKAYYFFINSNDFNGIPLTRLSDETGIDYLKTIELLKELVEENSLSIQETINPHIIGLDHFNKKHQIEVLDEAKKNKTEVLNKFEKVTISFDSHLVCIYPTTSYLKENSDLSEFARKPYSAQLAIAEPQLKLKFFEIEVLDKYFKNPRFSFDFKDYSGRISCKYDENEQPLLDKDDDQIFLESFGLGVDKNKDRVAVVYLRYLNGLTPEHQIYWKSKEIDNDCQMVMVKI